jgi:hypothetical protein
MEITEHDRAATKIGNWWRQLVASIRKKKIFAFYKPLMEEKRQRKKSLSVEHDRAATKIGNWWRSIRKCDRCDDPEDCPGSLRKLFVCNHLCCLDMIQHFQCCPKCECSLQIKGKKDLWDMQFDDGYVCENLDEERRLMEEERLVKNIKYLSVDDGSSSDDSSSDEASDDEIS